ncbi:MAG: DMT family transporter [Flavobacteriaceae bacterium]|nr:DMT family transporter [Flavobacteriaceae bacterium]
MIYLVLSVVFATSLFVIFKYFEIFKVDTLKAIVVNYIVAFILGFLLSENSISLAEIPNQPWFGGALVLGLLFVSIFFVMALTAQRNGVSVVSVAGKMSVVIPIIFGVILYNESLSAIKIIGIILAVFAVYLASVKEDASKHKKAGLLLPVILFLGSGTIDTTLKYVQNNFVAENEVAIFSGSLFGFAAFFGLLILIFKTIKKPESFGVKNLIAGIILGVPNYYSIVFLIKALQTKGFESSTLFTINNVGIVVVSTLVGLLLFKESFSLKNKIGILLAITGIVLVAIA